MEGQGFSFQKIEFRCLLDNCMEISSRQLDMSLEFGEKTQAMDIQLGTSVSK